MSDRVIGQGGYGTVVSRDGLAVKSLEKLKHLIHEYAAAVYLKKCPYIVKVMSCNFDYLEINMKLYKGSLSKWLKHERTENQKNYAFRETLKALTYLYDIGLVHGDIKPGNTLVNWNKDGDITELVLGDVGFLCIENYSKVERTTRTYQENEIRSDYRHDMYSLGVFLTEMYCDVKFSREDKYEAITSQAEKISNSDIRYWTLLMLSKNRMHRPSPRKVLWKVFNVNPPVRELIPPPEFHSQYNTKEFAEMKNTFKKWSESYSQKVGINRTSVAFQAFRYYVSRNQIDSSQWRAHVYAILVIFSSIFGDISFGVKSAEKYGKASKQVIKRYIYILINDEDFLRFLFYSKRKSS